MAQEKFVLSDEDLTEQHSGTPFRQTFEVDYAESAKQPSPEPRRKVVVDSFEDEDQDIESQEGYYAPTWKLILFYLLGVCTFGLSFLLSKWTPRVSIFLRYARCSLDRAEYVLITTVDGTQDLRRVELITSYDTYDSHASSSFRHSDDGKANLLNWKATKVHRLIEFRCYRYFFREAAGKFIPVPDVPTNFNSNLQQMAMLTASTSNPAMLDAPAWDLADRQLRYGTNEMKIPVKSILMLLYEEMWHPFYVFQYFSIYVWVVGDQYYTYSVCIFVITWFSIITSAVETHSNMKRLASIAEFTCMVEVLRGGEWVQLSSTELVPGDLVAIQHGILSADVVLIKGECILDENMLTGESVPVRKVSYSPVAEGLNYGPDKSANCTLYGGTMVAQARATRGQRPLGMVVRTRFYSSKGQLLRSILFPKEHSQDFVSDSLKFIVMMLFGCIAMYIWSAAILFHVGAKPGRIAWRFFDMITIAVPPALPACLTICTVFAIGRLRDKQIYVTSPERIQMAGHLDVICFDKTGTLTQPGMHLKGIMPVGEGKFKGLVNGAGSWPALLEELMACCHGLARMGQSLVGDPLDQKLFEATGWSLMDDEAGDAASPTSGNKDEIHSWVQPPGKSDRYSILRRFEFTSEAQRNGVVVKYPDGRVHFFVKGSPEMVRKLVQQWSVPSDFDKQLAEFARDGLRILALAMADFTDVPKDSIGGMSQMAAEAAAPLQLVGLACMENPLRDDSADVILKLQTANIRCAMVTGDHVRTAISVAHQCSIMPDHKPVALIDGLPGTAGAEAGVGTFHVSLLQPDGELVNTNIATVLPKIITGEVESAVTGKGFRAMVKAQDTQYLPTFLQRGSVFARMSPDDKKDLIELMGNGLLSQEGCPGMGYHVGFCGDGANDCGALKAAHVGVSLCEAEASVAAPMTSKHQSIASMITVVAEGRCTLMATYQIFQFIIGYALVQAFSTNLMYTYALDMGNYQYLVQDLFFTTVLAGLMGYTHPRAVLSPEKPLKRVMSLPLMMSTVSQLLVVVFFQGMGLVALQKQPGYSPSLGTPDLKTVQSPENTTMYLIDLGQYIILAIIFNKGYPQRSPLYTNTSLLVSMILQVIYTLFSIFSVNKFNTKVQELVGNDTVITTKFRVIILVIILVNMGAALLAELLLTPLVLWMARAVQSAVKGKPKV